MMVDENIRLLAGRGFDKGAEACIDIVEKVADATHMSKLDGPTALRLVAQMMRDQLERMKS